jgi:cell wall-associated NlpC family hydrolase
MKWLIGIVSTLMITGCATPTPVANADTQFVFAEDVKPQVVEITTAFHITSGEKNTNSTSYSAGVFSPERKAAAKLMLEVQNTNATNIRKTVGALKKRVGRTWYVFSGSTPQGWDCSGLVMWAYQQMGVELEHRASKQQRAGTPTTEPKLGDIVAFTYKNSKYGAYHVGIYLGKDKMIHAGGGKGETTQVASISQFAGKYSKVSYINILETPATGN